MWKLRCLLTLNAQRTGNGGHPIRSSDQLGPDSHPLCAEVTLHGLWLELGHKEWPEVVGLDDKRQITALFGCTFKGIICQCNSSIKERQKCVMLKPTFPKTGSLPHP